MSHLRGGDGPSGSRPSMGPLPNRWLHCPRKAKSIIATRFLAFKTPLSKAFNDQMPVECLFPPEMIFGYCKMVKLKLGLWIDLTNTKRFYDRAVVEANGAKYIKLQCRGHGETPSPEQTRSFIEIVDNFMNEFPSDKIGVHCTHGFNRTGFLIVSYMVERMDCAVEAALALFAQARPPGIYKQDYINELFRRYQDEEDAVQAPELPAWSLEYDDGPSSHKRSNGDILEVADNNEQEEAAAGADTAQANGDAQPARKKRREFVVKNATFMTGVSGVNLITEQPLLGELQQKVQDMCGWGNKSGFPGAQPVSINRNNIKRLHEIPYRVSWKADGTRYMMLIKGRDEIYFIDRNNSCFEVENMTFLKAGNLDEHLENTLLDGEMVLDKHQGQVTPRYLIYDIIKISNQSIGQRPFYPDRLRCIRKEIIDPRHEAIIRGIINRPLEPFGVRNKDFWDIRQSVSLLSEKFSKSLLHEPDGLIFQPSKAPYTAGVCPDVLKWKPSDMNSIDFRLKIAWEEGQGVVRKRIGLLYVGGHEVPFCQIKCTKTIKDLDNKIIECSVNSQGMWEFMRERTDKTLPNSYNTAVSVCESIRHPVTKDILLDYVANYGFRDEGDIMPPPSSHRHMQAQRSAHDPNRQQQQHQQQIH